MNNENNNNTSSETGINRQFFEEVVQNSGLSSEDKKKIGEFKDFKNDTVREVLKIEDKDKIGAYDKLNIKELPGDWELKLERLKEFEKHEADYLKKKEELKAWTDTFGEKKPDTVQTEIKELEEKNEKITEELKVEKENHSLTESELKEWKTNFLNQSAVQVKEKNQELEVQVKEWTQFFDYRDLEEIKKEITELRSRPELSISEEQFWEDFAQRKSLQQQELDQQELAKERQKSTELEQENNHFKQSAHRILESIRNRKYALSKPIITVEEAQKEIPILLARAVKKYENYLQSSSLEKELDFELSIYPDKKSRIKQVLAWIKEAQETKDYQKLYENWNGGKIYNKENDFVDGSLSLLKKYLDVINEEFSESQIVSEEDSNKNVEENEVLAEQKAEEVAL